MAGERRKILSVRLEDIDYFPGDVFALALVFLAMLKHQLQKFLQPHKGISVHWYLINVFIDYPFVVFQYIFAVIHA